MAGTLVPFTFVPGRTDTSDFRTLTRPIRAMSVREEWVYNQVAVDWAQLGGQRQKAIYAQACMTDLAAKIWQGYWNAATEILEGLDRINSQYGARPGTVPPKRDHLVGSSDLPMLMNQFATRLLDSTGSNALQLQEAAGHELGRIATRSLDPPSEAELARRARRGIWQRVLDVDGRG